MSDSLASTDMLLPGWSRGSWHKGLTKGENFNQAASEVQNENLGNAPHNATQMCVSGGNFTVFSKDGEVLGSLF